MKKVIVITGPTASGKTKIAIDVAQHYGTSLINGDAFQIYQGLDILTAKPSQDELQKVPHYLMGTLDSLKSFSIYDYQKIIRSVVDETNSIPIIVGGSGLYIDSVLYNYRFLDDVKNEDFAEYSSDELYAELKRLDPVNASKIHPNNRKRLERAITLAKSQNSTERNLKHQHFYEPLIIVLQMEREILYDRINKRVVEMFNEGIVEEVKHANNIGPQLAKAIGYPEIIKYLNGEISKDECIEVIQKATRHYAKRQLTWFRNHPDCVYVNVDYDNYQSTLDTIIQTIDKFRK